MNVAKRNSAKWRARLKSTIFQSRQEAYEGYVRALMNRRASPEEVLLRNGLKYGTLTVKDRKALEAQLEEQRQRPLALRAQIVGYMQDFIHGGQVRKHHPYLLPSHPHHSLPPTLHTFASYPSIPLHTSSSHKLTAPTPTTPNLTESCRLSQVHRSPTT